MATFRTALTQIDPEQAIVRSDGKPDLTISSPPEFGGKDGNWTPEDALCLAVESCLMLTTMYFVKQMKIGLESYASTTTGSMDKTPSGLRFSGIEVAITATVASEEDVAKLTQAVTQAEKFCPVSAAVSCPVNVTVSATPSA